MKTITNKSLLSNCLSTSRTGRSVQKLSPIDFPLGSHTQTLRGSTKLITMCIQKAAKVAIPIKTVDTSRPYPPSEHHISYKGEQAEIQALRMYQEPCS